MLRTASVIALVSTAAAQSTTVVSLFLPEFDPQPLAASVIGADATATSYVLACQTDSCGASPTVVNGPSTFEIHYTQAAASGTDAFTIDGNCNIAADVATCTESVGPGSDVATSSLSQISTLFLPVTVTAGLDNLSITGSATGGPSSPVRPTETIGTEPLPSPIASPTTSPTESSSSSPPSSSSSSSPSSSNPGAPQKTQNVIFAGIAAVAGGLIML